jgi:hypothetical protein
MKIKPLTLLLIFLSITAGVLIFWKIFSRKSPKPEEKPNLGLGILPAIDIKEFKTPKSSIKYDFFIPDSFTQTLPKTIQVYRLKNNQVDLKRTNEIAAVFGFNQSPEEKHDTTSNQFIYYQFSDTNQFLKITPKGEISYKYSVSQNPNIGNSLNFDSEEAVDLVKQKLEKLGLKEKDPFDFQFKINYLKIGPSTYVEVNDISQADSMEIDLTLSLDKLPILKNNPEISYLTARIGNLKQILSFSMSLIDLDRDASGIYPVKNLDQIKTEISQGLGKFVYLKNSPFMPGDSSEIPLTEVNFNGIQIAYYFDQENSLLQPIFVISGTAFLASNQSSPIIIYLPAISQ